MFKDINKIIGLQKWKNPKYLYHLTNDKDVLNNGLNPNKCKQCKFINGIYLTDDIYVAYNYRFLDEDKKDFFIIEIPFNKLDIKSMYPDDYELFDLIDEEYHELLEYFNLDKVFGNEKIIFNNLDFKQSLFICNQILYISEIKPSNFNKIIYSKDITDKNIFSLISEGDKNISSLSELLEKYGITLSLKEILQRWNESHRGYHNIEHLKDLLKQIGKIDSKEKELLVLISLFHDIIYDPKNSDNEEQSAKFLLNSVKEVTEDIKKVYQSILDTKNHKSSNELSEIFNKMDMNVVTRNFDELLKWEKGIRKEYSVFSDEDYKKGRIKFLKSLLNDYPENKENLMKLIDYIDGNLNEGLLDKIKSRASDQEKQMMDYIDNIDFKNLSEDDIYSGKLRTLLDTFHNQYIVNKIINELPNELNKFLNYIIDKIYDYSDGQNTLLRLINKLGNKLNKYGVTTLIDLTYLNPKLNKEKIFDEIKKYKGEKMFNDLYSINYYVIKDKLNKNKKRNKKKDNNILKDDFLNENFESRQEEFKIFAKKVTEKMGIPEPQYLDSGFFGSAFVIDNNRILKITTDKSEALNANKIKNKTTYFIAKVFDVRGFKFKDKDYFFIILEKVKTDFEFLYGIIENLISWFDENHDEDFITYITEGEFKDLKQLEIELYNDNKQLYNFFTNFVELKKELIKYNITSADFINASNLGFRGKRVVAFDLGISDDEGNIENFDLFEGLGDKIKSRAPDQEKQRNDYIRKEGLNDYTITLLFGKNHDELPSDIQSMIFSFYEQIMEKLMRSNDNHWKKIILNKIFIRDVFKLLPDEFKFDIINLRINFDMGLDKYHFESATNEQKDEYLDKVKQHRV